MEGEWSIVYYSDIQMLRIFGRKHYIYVIGNVTCYKTRA